MANFRSPWTSLGATLRRRGPSPKTWRLIARAAASSVLALLLLWANLFNTSAKTDEASNDSFLSIVAPFVRDRPKDDPVVVLLFTPQAIDDLRRTPEQQGPPTQKKEIWNWPITFHQEKDLLHRITAARPRSVFFDLAFYQDRHDGLEDFVEAIKNATAISQDYQDAYAPVEFPLKSKDGTFIQSYCGAGRTYPCGAHVPVFLAETRQTEKHTEILSPLCQAGAEGVSVEWEAPYGSYPMSGKTIRKTAAVRMLEEWCDRVPERRQIALKVCLGLPQDIAQVPVTSDSKVLHTIAYRENLTKKRNKAERDMRDRVALGVTWGIGMNPEQEQVGDATPQEFICDPGVRGFWNGVERFLAHLGFWSKAVLDRHCSPPILTILASAILRHGLYRDPNLGRFLLDKFVIVGADFPGMHDVQGSPVNGEIPGVYLHAMALDNLLESGPDYVRAYREDTIWSPLSAVKLLTIALTLFLALWLFEHARRKHPPIADIVDGKTHLAASDCFGAMADMANCFFILLMVCAVFFAVAFGLFFVFRLAPLNWFGIAIVVAGLTVDEIGRGFFRSLAILLLFLPPVRWAAKIFVKPDPKGTQP